MQLLNIVNQHHVTPGNEIHFVTSALSKSVISENNPYFEGCMTLKKSEIQELVGKRGCLIGIGAWTTGKDTGNQNIRSENTVLASRGGVFVGADYFPEVDLKAFIQKLTTHFTELAEESARTMSGLRLATSSLLTRDLKARADKTSDLGYDAFFKAIESWINEDDVMIVDAGFPLIGAQTVKIPARNGFIAQAAWLAIGYSVAAATGVKMCQAG